MRALYFAGPRRLEWREAPEPRREDRDDALVRPVAVALCDADVQAIRGELAIAGRFPCGHEFVAEVLEVGDESAGFHPGQLVVLPVQISCGACARCRAGKTAFCTSVRQPAAWGLGAFGGHWPGAFAERLRVPFASHLMVPVPTGVDPLAATSAGDNIADAWRSVIPPLRELPGAEVLVIGRASIGLYAAGIAVAGGAGSVTYLDDDVDRLASAEGLGAACVEGRDAPHGAFPIVVDATFGGGGLETALRAVAPGGICTSVFPGFRDAPLPLFEMWRRAVRFHTGVASCRAHMEEVLALIASRRLRPELVTTEFVAWDDAAEALADPSLKPIAVRGAARRGIEGRNTT